MDDQQVNYNQNRDRDDDNGEPSRKNQKLDTDNAPEPKSITNICIEMVDRIFDYLNIESLLNVAQTCKRLQTAAITKFRDKHGQKNVDLKIVRYGGSASITIHHDAIDVSSLKFCLPFLRVFGAEFSTLSIKAYHLSRVHHSYLDQYINKYCAKTLASIRFVEKSSFSIDNFPTPFTSVKDVYIGHSNLGQQLPLIAQLFPNVNHLFMYGVSIAENFTAVSFPQLENLVMNDYENFTMDGVLHPLHANRQLKCFQLSLKTRFHELIDLNVILDMIAENPSISKLCILNGDNIFVDPVDLLRFANERPSMIDVDLKRCFMIVDDVIMFIRQQPILKRICFKVHDHTDYDHLKDELGDEWRFHHTFFDNNNPSYPFNHVVTMTR